MGVGVPIYEIRNKYLCEVFPFYEIIRKQEFNRDKIYEMLLHFDKIFDKLDDEEKQQLIQALISKVEVYKKNEIKTTKTYINEITYAFDVFNLDTNFLGNKSNNVETVCLLSRKDK